jgi:hypothetical protein
MIPPELPTLLENPTGQPDMNAADARVAPPYSGPPTTRQMPAAFACGAKSVSSPIPIIQ